MTKEEFFKLVPAKQFFKQYCPEVKRFYHKSRGIDGNGKAVDFSVEDKKLMTQAVSRLAKDIQGVKF